MLRPDFTSIMQELELSHSSASYAQISLAGVELSRTEATLIEDQLLLQIRQLEGMLTDISSLHMQHQALDSPFNDQQDWKMSDRCKVIQFRAR